MTSRTSTSAWVAVVAAVVVVLLLTAGCVSIVRQEATLRYYLAGPESALEMLEMLEPGPGQRSVVAMERSIPLLELGRYEESNTALAEARKAIDGAADTAAELAVTGPDDGYLGEYHERVLVDTLTAVNLLALQQPAEAVAPARRAVERAASLPCEPCNWGFTRYVLATALEAVGDEAAAAVVLAEAVSEAGWEAAPLSAALDRLLGLDGSLAEVFAPPPPGPAKRELVVLLLLGPGPAKVRDWAIGSDGRPVAWPGVVGRGQPVVASVVAQRDERQLRAKELTDVERLARAAVRSRFHRWRKAVEAGEDPRHDVRLDHWSLLPASMRVARVPVPDGLTTVTLSYRDRFDAEIEREPIAVPADWERGMLFVVRRMP